MALCQARTIHASCLLPRESRTLFYIQKHPQQQGKASPCAGAANREGQVILQGSARQVHFPSTAKRRLKATSWPMDKRMCLLDV